MIKPIVSHGNGKAVTIQRAILEAVGIDPDGSVQLTIEKGRIILAPAPRHSIPAQDRAFLRAARV